MPRENLLTLAAVRLARIPFALFAHKGFDPPQKVLIIHPCCLSQVMLATPLLAVLAEAYPQARFDWAISDWARPAIAGNPRVTELISTGEGDLGRRSWRQIGQLTRRLHAENYDTAFIPSRSGLLSYIAWRAGIKQRIGLHIQGRGFAHTRPVKRPERQQNTAQVYLALARAVGIDEDRIAQAGMEFYPSDQNRTSITQRLIEEIDWLGDVPLVVFHPGGAENPVRAMPIKRWPPERFALLGNHLVRKYQARIVLVGSREEQKLAQRIDGYMGAKVNDLCGQLSLGEIGALCEVADLYVGNDAGPTHIAAATGCPTVAIYGPNNPVYSQPYEVKGRVKVAWRDLEDVAEERPFTWDIGVTVDEVIKLVDELLEKTAERGDTLAFLTAKNGGENG